MGDNLMNFNERCRLCIEPKRLSIDIFSDEGRRIKLKSKISKHLSVKVSQSDGLPSQICYQCLFRLETWVNFKQLCIERDQAMKTWCQSFMDENSCDLTEEFNGDLNPCKVGKARECDVAKSSRLLPNSIDQRSKNETLSSSVHHDDAMSDSSLWEIVKVDDTGVMECKRQGRTDPLVDTNGRRSPAEHCTIAGDSNLQESDQKRRKIRKPSKGKSSGFDSSLKNQGHISFNEMSASTVNHISMSSESSSTFQPFLDSQISPSVNSSTPPLKRKRGRPSKASLQRERDLKKTRDNENDFVNVTDVIKEPLVDDVIKEPLVDDVIKEPLVDEGYSMEELAIDEELNEAIELPLNTHDHIAVSDFTPIDRDDGSGVTEVVLDDPDFGSMKFTLSVVHVESPISSPIPNDDYKCYPESCASSCGNISSDSHHFEGFESPSSSTLMKPKLIDSIMNTSSEGDEMSRSTSQFDVRLENCEEFTLAGITRKRSISASGDFQANVSTSHNFSDDQDFMEYRNLKTSFFKKQFVSKSFESLKTLDDSMIEESPSDSHNDRNAHSDGEISESPKKYLRKKSLISGKSYFL